MIAKVIIYGGLIMRAIVLCGGKGEKIWPYNEKNQKSCLPVGNTPNILRIVEQLESFHINDIVLLTGYLEQQVKYALRKKKSVKYVSAYSENMARVILEVAQEDQDFLVYYGDIYAEDEDLRRMLLSYQENGNSALLNRCQGDFHTTDYICAMADEKIYAYYGRPRKHYVNARSAGIFIVKSDVLEYVRYAPKGFSNLCVGGMSKDEFYFEQCLQTAIEDEKSIHAVYTQGRFVDIDFPWDIMDANEAYCLSRVSAMKVNKIGEGSKISEQAEINGCIKIGKNSFIGSGVRIEGNCEIGDNTVVDNGVIIGANSVIGSRSIVKDYCKISPSSVIGNDNKIGFSAEVTGVTFDRVAAVHNCELYGIVGANTDIAANCQMGILRFDDGECTQKVGEKRYGGKFANGIFLGDYSRTGVGNIFFPGVKVGVHCALGPGLIINKDIKSRKLVLVNQEIVEKDWGPEKYGW